MKRGKPLERRTPIRRTRMRKALPRRITRPGPGSSPAYLTEARKLPCLARDLGPKGPYSCEGDIVAHHAGPKVNDSTAVPLCAKHHQQWHDANGVFKGWGKEGRRAWAKAAIDATRLLVAAATPGLLGAA